MRVVLSGGGTGGHLYPALTIAETMDLLLGEEPLDLLLIGARRGIERTILPNERWPARFISAQPVPSRLSPRTLLAYAGLALGYCEASLILRRMRPDVVVGTGGYASVCVVKAAAALGIPTLIHDMDAKPGRASRALARVATKVTVGYKRAIEGLGRPDAELTGNPLRPKIGSATREEGLAEFGLDPERLVLIVLGGSQGARTLNTAVTAALPRLVDDLSLQILHVTGRSNEQDALAAVRDMPAEVRQHHHIVAYLDDNMHLALAAADLALCRAGASTVNEVAACGVPAVYVPYPFAGGHQALNAEEAVDAGAGIVIEDPNLTDETLVEAFDSILADNARERMSAAAREWAWPGSAERIAEIALELGGWQHP